MASSEVWHPGWGFCTVFHILYSLRNDLEKIQATCPFDSKIAVSIVTVSRVQILQWGATNFHDRRHAENFW
jgi:hypothetical protein